MNRVHDYLTSLLRTWVPIGWGALLAWLVSAGVLDGGAAAAAERLGPELAAFVAVLAGWAFYALARLVEPALGRLPGGRWLVRLLLGSSAAPSYTAGTERGR